MEYKNGCFNIKTFLSDFRVHFISMRALILLCVSSIIFVSGGQETFLTINKNGDTVLQDVTKRVSTNAKTELWKNVANFIDRYSPLKNGNQVVHELTMKKDVDKLLLKMGPLPFPWGRLGLRPTLMK